MKKRSVALLLCITLAGVTGCANSSREDDLEVTSEYETTDGEEILNDSDSMLSISVEKIPFDNIKYNDESFSLKSLSAYVGKSESGYGYHPYIVAEFDLSALSEDAYYWMMKDWGQHDYFGISSELTQTFGSMVYIDSEQNNLSHESLEKLKSWEEGKTVYYIFYLPDEYKNDFSDMEISFSVNVTQDETYEYENDEGEVNELNKMYSYDWFYINAGYSDLKISILDIGDAPDNVRRVVDEYGISEIDSENPA